LPGRCVRGAEPPPPPGVNQLCVVRNPGPFVPLAELEGSWQTYAESGQFPIAGTLGSIKRTTLAGTLALSADFQGSTVAGELISRRSCHPGSGT